ncbi:MAG TPA: protein translocase subunit SecF [Thermoanaerobaculia bacterium]|nr:protein translocase subunit SecF [Thermoanaerobaculia bacterium]
MRIFDNPNFDFIKYRWHAVIFSLLLISVGLVWFVTKGINLGIDFAGGANIILKFQGDPPIAQLRSDLPVATIQQYGQPKDNAVLIRLPKQEKEGDYAGQIVGKLQQDLNANNPKHDLNFLGTDRLSALLIQADPDNRGSNPAALDYYRGIAKKIIDHRSEIGIFHNMGEATSVPGVTAGIARVLNEKAYLGQFNMLNQETVGPQVGGQLQQKAMWAIILSSLAMGIYIWLRFDLVFGVAAMLCIVHDVAIAMTFLLLLRLEFSLNVVAAILTIVGYSVNDTVVTYDRVRENKRKIKRPMSLGDHLNLAMNQTLSRTILTAGSVFLVLLAMLALGGEVIRGFSWILTIGVISGTYSTLLIVPAVVVLWDNWASKRRPATAAARVDTPVVDAPVVRPARKRRAS